MELWPKNWQRLKAALRCAFVFMSFHFYVSSWTLTHFEALFLQVVLEGDLINLDVTSPAATVALGLMFLKTNDETASSLFVVPGMSACVLQSCFYRKEELNCIASEPMNHFPARRHPVCSRLCPA